MLNQGYPNLEYIIIDGGSTDETVDIIKKYAAKLTYWVSEKDSGQTEAINKGFAKCTGEIFNWINSDDYYEPGALHTIANLFMDNTRAQVVCGKEWGFQDTKPDEKVLHTGSILKQNVFETIREGIIDQPCTFFKTDAVKNIFPLDTSLRYVMDKQLWWAYLLQHDQHQIITTEEVFTNFRLHAQSKTVVDGDLFENDFDRLKFSLMQQLNAPEILLKQIPTGLAPTNMNWKINISPANYIMAAFATYYAERNYVNENLEDAGPLMQYVKKWKGYKMNSKDLKLWAATCIIPKSVLMNLKRIKQKF